MLAIVSTWMMVGSACHGYLEAGQVDNRANDGIGLRELRELSDNTYSMAERWG